MGHTDQDPCSLPVPSLWIDVLQKVKALGFNCVSFYIDWALLEGKPGEYTAEGIFALEPFFDAAKEAGIYLLARPGPYINAEASGGGFPGWLQRVNGTLRTSDEAYLKATDKYVTQPKCKIGSTVSTDIVNQLHCPCCRNHGQGSNHQWRTYHSLPTRERI